jgi:hypothetical protein
MCKRYHKKLYYKSIEVRIYEWNLVCRQKVHMECLHGVYEQIWIYCMIEKYWYCDGDKNRWPELESSGLILDRW